MAGGQTFSAPISLLSASIWFIALATMYKHTLAFDLWIDTDLVTQISDTQPYWRGSKFDFVEDSKRRASTRVDDLYLYLKNLTSYDRLVLNATVPQSESVQYWTWFEQRSGTPGAVQGSVSPIAQNGTLLNGSVAIFVITQCLKQLSRNVDVHLRFSYVVIKNGNRSPADETFLPFRRNCQQGVIPPTTATPNITTVITTTSPAPTTTPTTTPPPPIRTTTATTRTTQPTMKTAKTSTYPAITSTKPILVTSGRADEKGPDSSSSSSGTILIIIIILGVAVLLVGIIVGCLVWQRRLRKRELPRSAALEEAATESPYALTTSSSSDTPLDKKELTDAGGLLTTIDKRFTIDRHKIRFGKQLGQGAFGIVFEGWFGQQHVAIKTMKGAVVSGQKDKEITKFMEEAKIMQDFDHPNVLRLIGVSLATDGLPRILVPFMSNGDLLSFLRKRNPATTIGSTPLPEDMLISFTVQIAQGMAYLAEKNFVHRDLAARNCMLSEDAIVKIADFGLTRDIEDESYYKMQSEFRLPIRWMAIESLSFHKFSCQSDVWSYGIVLWEVFTLGQIPYSSMENVHITHFLQAGGRLAVPEGCPKRIGELMLDCWQNFPSKRPTFQQILRRLESYNKEAYENIMQLPCYVNLHEMSPTRSTPPSAPRRESRQSRSSETGSSTLSQQYENGLTSLIPTMPISAGANEYEEMRRRQTAESKHRP